MPEAAHGRMVAMVRHVLPEQAAGLLVGDRHWPLPAARMHRIGESDGPPAVGRHLAGLADETAWNAGPPGELAGRLVGAMPRVLTAQPGTPLPEGHRVSAGAARSRSTTTPTGAAPGQAAPAERAVPAHRQQPAPAKAAGRGR
ncbi:hypothetical protein [Streptomyces sp. NPDC096339]|uniref:hypothetical protein n=1 Tax=Streptomyces sp. NPDC096339 TaxID=3366086 RepID=UPI003819BB23